MENMKKRIASFFSSKKAEGNESEIIGTAPMIILVSLAVLAIMYVMARIFFPNLFGR